MFKYTQWQTWNQLVCFDNSSIFTFYNDFWCPHLNFINLMIDLYILLKSLSNFLKKRRVSRFWHKIGCRCLLLKIIILGGNLFKRCCFIILYLTQQNVDTLFLFYWQFIYVRFEILFRNFIKALIIRQLLYFLLYLLL